MSTTLIVLFNLKAGADIAAYEAWAKASDLVTVRGLSSINKFEVFKTAGVLGSEAPAPYQYVELLEVNDMDTFFGEVGSDTMKQIASEFQAFADNPTFMLSHNIEGA